METDKFYYINVSTFPPRRCGIASFAKDMMENLDSNNWIALPIVRKLGCTSYAINHRLHIGPEIKQDCPISYDAGAGFIVDYAKELRSQGGDLGCFMNHENGIFGEDDRQDNATRFLEILNEGKVAVFGVGHTVLYDSKREDFIHKRNVLKNILEKCDKFACLTNSVLDILMDENLYGPKFGVSRGKLIHIAHGIPKINILKKRSELKREYDFVTEKGEDKKLFTSIGYISRAKGLEFVIEGLDIVLGKINGDALVGLIAGGTHQEVLAREGEKYRDELIALAKTKKNIRGAIITRDDSRKEKITDLYGKTLGNIRGANLVFLNVHLSDDELLRVMKMSDCGIIANLGKDQISSGPGAYWIGSSRITIATESPFFRDMEKQGIGLLVPFSDSKAIADRVQHVISLSEDDFNELEFIASDFGCTNTWSIVGKQYRNLMDKLIRHKAGLRDDFD